ncbi:RNA polymerase sigma factor [Homoserinimonas sp. OAct 916]|uniref:RNA polymerase sigma factor n=1 Tax=Homoserinimonas sp. OAct 916 TaxID=2211450 RepID=UPI000DBE7D3D|nr:sigma-70 family RNA polymerase sigma factor [Homoserinimonas sp. OAct 916]
MKPERPPAVEPAEGDLLASMFSGHTDALRSVFQLHQRAVYFTAFNVLHSRHDAEEIMQDAFLLLWKKHATIALVGGSTLPWLVTTSRYLALNRRRARDRERTHVAASVGEVIEVAPSPEALAETSDTLRSIDEVVRALPELDQKVFHLCLLESISYEQAARRLGLTHGSVRNRLARLRVRLRSELHHLKGT